IHLQSRIWKTDLSDEERHYLSLVCNLTANALEIAEGYETIRKANSELQKRNQLLSTIFEMSRDFSLPLSKEEIANHLKFRILGQLLVNKFAFFYKDNDKIEVLINLFDQDFNVEQISGLFSLSSIVSCEVLDKFDRERYSIFFENNQTELIYPIMYHNLTRGIFLLGRKYIGEPYTPEDISFIEALGGTVIRAIENFRLFQQEVEKKQIEKELELALEIQKNLLPKKIPEIIGLDVWGLSIPSRAVGGDYFDIIKIDDATIYVAIADVSGKGVPAALLMANLQSALKALTTLGLSILEIVKLLNSIIYENTSPDIFITFFLCRYNSYTKELEYINAGHNPPILYRLNKDEFFQLNKGGIFLGFSDSSINYETGKFLLERGDLLIIYTDGLTEASGSDLTEFGLERLKVFLKSMYTKSAKEICDDLIKEIYHFCNSKDLKDDLTLIVMKVK
ncbi:MAG: PP2C family protein-serine/threonine phosphatase, partial [Candidatus Kapaibacteriota bacterium]